MTTPAQVRAQEPVAVLRSRIDLTGLPALSRSVTEQVICASADLGYASDLVCSEPALEAAVAALAAGAPVIADGPVVAAGIASSDCGGQAAVTCKASEPLAHRLARTAAIPLAAAAVRLSLGEAGHGAIWVVGSEPDAIYEILSRGAEPALVIGMPAGLTGAAQAKKALRGSGVPALTNVGDKGGPVVAAAALCALLAAALARAAASAQARPQARPQAWQRR